MKAKVLSSVFINFTEPRLFNELRAIQREKFSASTPRPVMWETHTFALFFTPPASPAIAG
jgi:hypothetical protein